MLTLSKIAKLANVSVSTASKAFSMSPEVNPETREMIFDIAKKHGCFKKFFNAKYPKLVIAVICPEFESLHYTSQLAKLQIALEKRGCEICVATTQFSKERGIELLNYYSKYARVDGIILLDGAGALNGNADIPIVCLGRANENATRVMMSRYSAIEEAIDYFLGCGVYDIGFIGEKLTDSKLRMFCSIMESRGRKVNTDFIAVGERFADGAYETTKLLIDSNKIPRALICAYDYLAIGTVKCLVDNGYRVPEDVAVLGMDDIPEAKYLNPPLSSIDSNINEACEAVADKIISMLMGKPYEKDTVINATLHLRKSTEISR